jgi:predicted RNA-binding protein with RPS1 domain
MEMETLQSLTSRKENEKLAQSVTKDGNFGVFIKTYNPITGWIHNSAVEADGYFDNASKLVNVDKLMAAKALIGAGKDGGSDNNYLSQDYKTILEEAKAQNQKVLDNPGSNVAHLIGAAPTGSNTIETAYENVRRVNYLTEVVGKQYNLNDYNAHRIVNVRRVSVLNVVGFTKTSALMQGIPEIGDHTTPPPMRQQFGTY